MAYISQTFSGGTDSSKYYARLYYEEVGQPDLEHNTTRVRLTLKIASNNGYYTFWGFNNNGTIKVDNVAKATGNYTGTVNTTEQTICSWEDNIEHTQDGSKTINIKFEVSSGYAGSASNNTNWTLTKVNRKADLTSAPDFNDDANPVINYNNPAGNSVATLQAGIFNTAGTVAYAGYRDISKTGSSYTFNLTATERTALRNASPNSNTLTVRFFVKTVIGSTTFYSTLDKTMTIVNAKPSLGTITYSEQNAKVSALLGSSGNTVIQNMSTLRVGVPVTAQKSSTISKVVITHNGRDFTDTTSPYSFDIPITSNSFTIKATSSRPSPNDTTTQTITKTMIDYKPVAINNFVFKRQTQTSSTILLSLDATYYQKTFGSTANAPIVKWKQDNGDWTTLTSSQYTIDTTNNKLTVSNLSLGSILAYTSQSTFYIYIEDKLSTAQNSVNVPRGQATLELGKNDVKVNGQLYTDNVKTKNMLDKTTITQEDITGGSGTLRMTTRQIIWLEAGTYTASTNMSSSYNWGIQIQNIGIPPLSSWPSSWVYNTNWLSTGTVSHTFTINSGGWFNIMLRRSDNGTFTSTDITNLRGFHYQLEKGSAQTEYSLFQETSGYDKHCKGEQRIGTWIDGKPLYRKIDNTSVSLSQNAWTNLRYKSGEECLIKCYISDKENFYDATSCLSYPVIARLYGNYIQIYSLINTTAKCVIVEYTKTTD